MKELRIHCNPPDTNWPDFCLERQILHNVKKVRTDGEFTICEYKGTEFKLIYKREPTYGETDIINILPFTYQGIFNLEKLKTGDNWYPMIIAAEKIFPIDLMEDGSSLNRSYSYHKLENMVNEFKHLTFYTDQSNFKSHEYKNEFLFTNTYFFWQRKHNFLLSYYYGNILNNQNFEYKLGFTVNRPTIQRVYLAKELNKIKECFVSQFKDPENENWEGIDNVYTNIISSDYYFDDLPTTKYFHGLGFFEQDLDMFFKINYKFETHIIDETWAEYDYDFKAGNITEKTFYPIMLNQPFISTHIYPLIFLDNEFSCGKHPFYKEISEISGKPDKILDFIKSFLNNYEHNKLLCQEYTDKLLKELVYRVKNENSMLDKIL